MPRKIWVVAALAGLLACKGGAADMRRGGVELVYDVAPADVDDTRAAALAEAAREVAAARLAALKIAAVTRADGRKLRVGLPQGSGAPRAEEAKAVLAVGGALELREVQDAAFLKELAGPAGDEADSVPAKVTRDTWTDANGSPRGCFMVDAADEASAHKAFPKEKLPTGLELLPQQGAPGERLVLLAVGAPLLTNEAVRAVKAIRDPMSTPGTSLLLTPEAAKKLDDLTDRMKGKKLAIVLDGKVVSAPIVMQRISTGEVQIPQPDVGDRKERERAAGVLAAALGAGAFSPPLTLVEERQVAKAR